MRVNDQEEGATAPASNDGVGPSPSGGGTNDRPTTDPALRESDCPLSGVPLDAPAAGSRGGCFSTVYTGSSGGVKRGGALYHAGSILRCRSAGNNGLRGPARGGFDARDIHIGIEASRPTLRAYSAPHFLHSALFPPKHIGRRIGGKSPVEASDTKGAGSTRTRERVHSRGGAWRKHETPLETEQMNAPCQHGRGGYLHRYQGFEQEKVSCPPVVTFRVLGGLGESRRRRRANTAPTREDGQNNNQSASLRADGGDPRASFRPGTASQTDSTYGLSEETPGSLTVEVSHEASTEKEVGSSAYPLDLFAEGSRVETVAPTTGERVRVTPAWCPGSKNRPRGAKRQASWGGSGATQQRKPALINKMAPRRPKMNQDGVPVGGRNNSSRVARRFGTATARSSPYNCKMNSSAFLPYSLERPVSTERSQAFFYTSN